ncbi:Retrovirus-related Pol polyprotein from transposon TNT 1-94 [Senna tora]|uniref:Retrovirus-related Pol polyprotein from transposon TNT 1-94 n=1 Tax=Senna tora TaxID=362788 RepID=A0A834XHE3_9FABA|nr:Retrovirus-related Pol polyprotein from transposon TNT 1-94 [Senna tora]
MRQERIVEGALPAMHHEAGEQQKKNQRKTQVKRDKLDKKAIPRIFVGYSFISKAYKVYHPQSKQMPISRDVYFNEDEKWDWNNSHRGDNSLGEKAANQWKDELEDDPPVREVQQNGDVTLVYCKTEDQIADLFAKPLPVSKFELLRERIGGSFTAFTFSRVSACSYRLSTIITKGFRPIPKHSLRRCLVPDDDEGSSMSETSPEVFTFYVPEEDDEPIERDKEGRLLPLLRIPSNCLAWGVGSLHVVKRKLQGSVALRNFFIRFMMYTYVIELLGVKPPLTPFEMTFLKCLNVCAIQLTANAWIVLCGFQLQCHHLQTAYPQVEQARAFSLQRAPPPTGLSEFEAFIFIASQAGTIVLSSCPLAILGSEDDCVAS